MMNQWIEIYLEDVPHIIDTLYKVRAFTYEPFGIFSLTAPYYFRSSTK